MKHRVIRHQLAGGTEGLVIDVPGSSVVSLQVRFNSGFQFGDPELYEVPHVLEHVLSTVTKKHPKPNEFFVEAQKNGAYVNAFTGVDTNGYVYECADFELDRILTLVDEQISEPLFERASVLAEIGNVREELTRNLTQHSTICAVSLSEKCYPHLWKGYEARIKQLPGILPRHLQDYHGRTHTARNARFYVAGHFPDGGERTAERLEKAFAKLPEGERFVRSREIGRGLTKSVVVKRDIEQLYYRIAMFFGELTEPQRRAATLLRMVLVGGMGSRVIGEARKRGLAYAVGGVGHAEPGNSSFGFTGYVTTDNADALFELVGREYAAVRDGGVTERELDAAKDLMIGTVKRSTQTVGDLLGWYVDPYDETGEIRDFDETMEQLQGVSVGQVTDVARQASGGGRRGLSFLGPVTPIAAARYASHVEKLWS